MAIVVDIIPVYYCKDIIVKMGSGSGSGRSYNYYQHFWLIPVLLLILLLRWFYFGSLVHRNYVTNYQNLSLVKQYINETIEDYPSKRNNTSVHPLHLLVKHLPTHHQLRILVTGGSGFIGSHLIDQLMLDGHDIIVNARTGNK